MYGFREKGRRGGVEDASALRSPRESAERAGRRRESESGGVCGWPPGAAAEARRERRRWRRHALAGLVLALTLLAASAPYLYGLARRPPGALFYAVPPVNYADATQYLAFARQAAEGAWLLDDPFTTEPHAPRLVVPHALLQGLLCRATGWSLLGAYHATRVVFGALLLAAAWWFGCLLLPRWRTRWLYLALLCTSGGMGWLLDRLPGAARPPLAPLDLLQPEANTLHTLLNLPHLSLAAALLTALFGARLALERQPERLRFWLAATAALAFALAWVHPFDFVTLGLGLGAYAVVRRREWVRVKAGEAAPSLRLAALHAAAMALGALPAGTYFAWLVATDPFYRALAADSLTVGPGVQYLVAHGLLLAGAGGVLLHPGLRRRYALPLCWTVCVFLFLLTPFRLGGKQPRLLGGVHVPLALLAAAGVEAATLGWARFGGRRARAGWSALWMAGFGALAATGGWGILERHFRFFAEPELPVHLPPSLLRTMGALERRGSRQETVLGGIYTAGWAPVLAGVRSFSGHWHLTLRAREKHREQLAFFLPSAPAGDPLVGRERAAWLRSRGIRWVLVWAGDWGGGMPDLAGVPGLRRVFQSGDAALYRFEPAGPELSVRRSER